MERLWLKQIARLLKQIMMLSAMKQQVLSIRQSTIDMLGMSYYDLYGFVIDVAFRTDRMLPAVNILPIYNPSTHDKALTRQFCGFV